MEFLTKHSTANNSFLKIGATIVFIALPLLGFVLGMRYQSMVYLANQAAITPTPTPVQTVVESSPSAQWQTYTNAKFGYSLDYPADWTAREFSDDKSGVVFQPSNTPLMSDDESIIADVSFKVISDPAEPSFEEYAKHAGKEIQNYGDAASFEKVTTTSGLTGYTATWYMGKSSKNASGPFTYYEVPKDNLRTLQVRGDLNADMSVYEYMIKSVRYSP